MMELVIMRHGQSTADLEDRHEGRVDFHLTDLGREQARKAALWLNENFEFDVIVSSPLKMASETARIISDKLRVEVIYNDALMEWNNGVLNGLLREESKVKYPISESERKYYHRIKKGESILEFRCRIEAFLAELIDFYDVKGIKKRILIISHDGAISMMFQSFLNLPINSNIRLTTDDTGIHVWKIDDDSRTVIKSNAVQHLK